MSRLDGAMVLDDRLGLLVDRPRMWNAGENLGVGWNGLVKSLFRSKNPYCPIRMNRAFLKLEFQLVGTILS